MVVSMAVQVDQATRERFSPASGHGEERAAGKPLPLENGDRLSRAEFERRYTARPDEPQPDALLRIVPAAGGAG